MRKNTRRIINAVRASFATGTAGDSIWTPNGKDIASYNTAILTEIGRDEDDKPLYVFNATRYSHTSTVHQNVIRDAFMRHIVVVLDDIARGTPNWKLGTLGEKSLRAAASFDNSRITP